MAPKQRSSPLEAFLARIPELQSADQRAFLYSDLSRQQSDNPEGYREALDFWSKLLLRACRLGLLSTTPGTDSAAQPDFAADSPDQSAGEDEDEDVLSRIGTAATKDADSVAPSVLTLRRTALAARLAYGGDTPMGVDTAVEALEQRGTLTAVGDVLSSSIVRRWAGRLALQLPLVGYRAAALAWATADVDDAHTLLVVQSLVDSAAERVVRAHYAATSGSLTDGLMSGDDFARRFAGAIAAPGKRMAPVDAQLLIRRLMDLGRLRTMHVDGAVLVKFAASRTLPVAAISVADRGAFHVVTTRDMIARQITQLESRTADLDYRTRQALTRGLRPQALAHMRLRRHIESAVLPKRISALERIEHVVLQLQQSSSDIQLMDAFRAGSCALQGLNRQAEQMDPESVFDEWADHALRAAEFRDAMDDATAAAVADPTADAEIEAELDALLADENAKKLAEAAADAEADALASALDKITIAPAASDPAPQQAIQSSEQRSVPHSAPIAPVASELAPQQDNQSSEQSNTTQPDNRLQQQPVPAE
ncbi:hypothetical protein H4R20_005802 [Coemansia guatemalensis]|uniref:Uncharacterized protein n=1 Tax=Coemansia guatemalensis TaxID=2761395 RepID=A0A9W8HR06_9FUNG|nr:hypothetical protein H4R20_005802 [Coemansia guatemalensis]